MNKLKDLLIKTREITISAKTLMNDKERRGENFDVFQILKLSHYEEKLHTPFLTELLNPKGSHGLKDAFLHAFIEIAHLDNALDFNTVSVVSEYNIGNKSADCQNGGRIDIYISDGFNNAIIIENKIHADDQENQLLRYYNYAKDNNLNTTLVYLTLEGNEPKDYSLGHKHFDYKCLSYRKTILPWITRCIEISSCYPLVRETLRQYITNLKSLLNIMDSDNLNKLLNLTTSPEYIESTLALLTHEEEITTQIRKQFILVLKEVAERNGLNLDYDEDLTSLQDNNYIWFYNTEISEHWAIYVGAEKHNKTYGVFYGISQIEYEKPHVTKKLISQIQNVFGQEQSSEYPYGWEFLLGDEGRWWNWRDKETLKDMVNGKLVNYIENEIVKPILKNHLLQKIEKLTTK